MAGIGCKWKQKGKEITDHSTEERKGEKRGRLPAIFYPEASEKQRGRHGQQEGWSKKTAFGRSSIRAGESVP